MPITIGKTTLASVRLQRSVFQFVGITLVCALTGGCHSKVNRVPNVRIIRTPAASAGGPEKLDVIEGIVTNAQPGQHIVLYAHSGMWWVQPFGDKVNTEILSDGRWKNSTHLGTEYAAILVDANYAPAPRTDALPGVGNGVVAVTVAAGAPSAPTPVKTIRFSGYEWKVRATGSDRGGEGNAYDVSNAWVDEQGFLHLRTAMLNGQWTCAEVALTHSLGYGTYKFVVQDSGHLAPSAVVGLFTFDEERSHDFTSEIDIELSRWGDPQRKNAQFVVQPFYVPENVVRFESPSGTMTHMFRWEPGRVTFESAKGATQGPIRNALATHTFSSGVPVAAKETVRMNLYDFLHSQHPSQPPAEVVIEKFEYLP